VRVHPTKVQILGVNGEKLLHALHLHLSDMLDLSKARGASISGDDLFLDPLAILPPPAVLGRLASIRVTGDQLLQQFVRTPDDSIFAHISTGDSTRNYVYFRGGHLRFGKLEMTSTDLLIADADERDPFDLYLAKYAQQLVAGTSRTLPNQGLKVLMPDYAVVARRGVPLANNGAAPER
jgi:hypothetical protein